MTNIIKAITKINPNAEVTVNGNDLDNIIWHVGEPISKTDIETKIAEMPTEEEEAQAKKDLKASAKAKLIAGEALTEEEANTIVL